MINEFQQVRDWKSIRGIGGDITEPMKDRLQSQYQRVMQEVIEIHDAIVQDDMDEFIDAIGDTIVTLINIADIAGVRAEDCLEAAFGVIKYRKGITTDVGDFVRYGKLGHRDQQICDEKQGNPGNEYFTEDRLVTLQPLDFKR